MNTNLKRIFAICMTVVLVLGVSACKQSTEIISSYIEYDSDVSDGNSGDTNVASGSNSGKGNNTSGSRNNSGSGNGGSGSNSNVPAKLRGTTVTIYNWNEMSTVPGAKNAFAKFTKETGIKVKWVVGSYDNYASELAAMVSADNAPDVLRLKCRNVALLKEMQPLEEACGYKFSDSVWDKELMSHYTIKGKVYATNYKNTLMQNPCMMIYNKSLISQYQLTDPYNLYKQGKWTMDAFVEICRAFVDKAGSGYYAWSPLTGEDLLNKRGVSYTNFDGTKYVNNMSNPQVLAGFKEHARYTEMGITTGSFYQGSAWESGKILFFTNAAISARKNSGGVNTEMQKKGTLGVVPMPKDTTLDKEYQVITEYESYGIAKRAKNAAAVPYMLSYYLDPSNYDEKNFFYDAKVLPMYKECLANPNKFVAMEQDYVLTTAFGLNRGQMTNVLVNTKAAQLESVLKQYSAKVDNAINKVNKELEKVQ